MVAIPPYENAQRGSDDSDEMTNGTGTDRPDRDLVAQTLFTPTQTSANAKSGPDVRELDVSPASRQRQNATKTPVSYRRDIWRPVFFP